MITLFAALQNIPGDLYEAARVDGAKTWDIVRRIQLPLLLAHAEGALHFFGNWDIAIVHGSFCPAAAGLSRG